MKQLIKSSRNVKDNTSMNTANIKKYAPLARNAFIIAVTKRANELGIYDSHSEEAIEEGQTLKIEGRSVDLKLKGARNKLISRVEEIGFTQLMEHIAYTWFNRLCAIRYMELHDYLDHGLCVLAPSPSQGEGWGEGGLPEILDHAQDVADDLGLNRDQVIELKLAGNQDELLYRTLLLGQCHALHKAMPFLFEAIDDETELLLPDNLTRTDSILRGLVNDIPAEDWEQVEIIGWLYQFYISEKKDKVIGKVVKSEDIPAATQLFTPNWIVKYLVQNSVGRQWLQTYPDSSIKAGMEYYIEPAEQTDEVNAQIKAITPASIEPESIKVLDPACGSGHILVEAYQVLKAIYEERGYRNRDIPQLILENNLFGLDIDDRAAQLAGFALMMLARADDKRIFTRDVQLNVMAMQESGEEVSVKGIALSSEEQETALQTLLDLFADAKTFGSLIQVPDALAKRLPELHQIIEDQIDSTDIFAQHTAKSLLPLIKQAEILARKYNAVVANPPYMSSKGMNADLKKFAKDYYPNAKSDLFGLFIERAFKFLKNEGFNAQVTIQNWMFSSSFEAFRKNILNNKCIQTLTQVGYNSFPELNSKVVQVAMCIIKNKSLPKYKGVYINLNSAPQSADKNTVFLNRTNHIEYSVASIDFEKILGSPIAYSVSKTIRDAFYNNEKIKDVMSPKQGASTGDDETFVRYWTEINYKEFGLGFRGIESARESEKIYFPLDKGGEFRKWYGNNEKVIRLGRGGYSDLLQMGNHLPSKELYFKKGITWSKITSGSFSCRYDDYGFVFSSVGLKGFPSESNALYMLGLMNSSVMKYLVRVVSPALSIVSGDLEKIPVVNTINSTSCILSNSRKLLDITIEDWNIYETSWDFQNLPLIIGNSDFLSLNIEASDATELHDKAANPTYKLSDIYTAWQAQNRATIAEMQRLEQENNRLFIEAYGLQDELTPDVPLEQITLTVNPKYRYGGNLSDEALENRFQSDTLAELISYAIGCMMGRYRLDKAGLIYAHAGNQDFEKIYHADVGWVSDSVTQQIEASHVGLRDKAANPTYLNTFAPDADGILPLTDQEWFKDDIIQRLQEFIGVAFSDPENPNSNHLQANLDFIAESLCLYAIKAKSGESSLETIRRYLCTQFYKDHLKTYKKRPIYWLFSSGKQKAFECLVYLHRYNDSTLARMRTEYVTPLLGKYSAQAELFAKQRDDANSTADANRFKKSLTALEKKQTELSEFDDKLKHYADMRISLDLDDGVKVNYGKFGDLLAEVKAITGKKA